MDRLAFRRLNCLGNGDPTVTGQVFETGNHTFANEGAIRAAEFSTEFKNLDRIRIECDLNDETLQVDIIKRDAS